MEERPEDTLQTPSMFEQMMQYFSVSNTLFGPITMLHQPELFISFTKSGSIGVVCQSVADQDYVALIIIHLSINSYSILRLERMFPLSIPKISGIL